MNKQADASDTSPAEKGFELLSLAECGQDTVVRDDQHEFPWILDAVRLSRHRKNRFCLVDSGFLTPSHLEWLAKEGADIYTSDDVGRSAQVLEVLNATCKEGGGILACLINGGLDSEDDEKSIDLSAWINLARSGAYLYISNKNQKLDTDKLVSLAHHCRKGKSWLVYYHHGPLERDLLDLACAGAWIHTDGGSLDRETQFPVLRDMARSAQDAGTNVVVFIENPIDLNLLWDVLKAKVIIRFKNIHFDYKSPYRAIEEQARRQNLNWRAYYLSPDFVL
jgi:hypothetical protein